MAHARRQGEMLYRPRIGISFGNRDKLRIFDPIGTNGGHMDTSPEKLPAQGSAVA